MTNSRTLTRMPVYDISNGRIVGRVHRLVIDPDSRKVVGLLLATRLGKEARCLPYRNIHSVGEHAVTVRGMDAISRLSELPDIEDVVRSQRRIYNSPILTEDGSFVGDVDEFTVNTQSGRIDSLLISGGLIHDLFKGQAALPAHFVVTIGEDATIVRDQAVTALKQRQREQAAAADKQHRASGGAPRHDGDDTVDERADGRRPTIGERLRRTFSRPGRRVAIVPEDDVTEVGAGKRSAEPTSKVPVVVIDGRADRSESDGKEDDERSTNVPSVQIGHQPGLKQHVVQDADDVVPPGSGDGGEGGDRKL